MPGKKPTHSVNSHYDAIASNYHEQYAEESLFDLSKEYPANYFRLQLLLRSFKKNGIRRVVEVGVGEGTPLTTLGKEDIDVWGFDISPEMVKKSKQTMQNNGMNPDHIFLGDIQDPGSYAPVLKEGLFDGLMAMGVMPHIENDDAAIQNMSSMIRPGGRVFIEFRNKLFSLFTFNRYTADFIVNDLLKDVNPALKAQVASDLESRLRMDMPPIREKAGDSDAPGYDQILAKFHNPLEMVEVFQRHNFEDIHLLWYHYHPAMPFLQEKMPELYRKEAMNLEYESSNWRGLFLCSAFVVEAVKK